MKALSPALLARIARHEVVVRDYLWIGARHRDSGEMIERGWWGDNGPITARVRWADGSVVEHEYMGGVGFVSVSTVPLVVGLTAEPVRVELGATAEAVRQVVKGWTVKHAPVYIHRGFLNSATMRLEEPAELRFLGTVDKAPSTRAEIGGESGISLECAPHTQELLRSSERMRSDADQRRRNPTDGGFRHVDREREQLEWTRA